MKDCQSQGHLLGRGIWGACAAWVLVWVGVWVFLLFWHPGGMRPTDLLPEFDAAYEDTTPQKVFYVGFFAFGLAGSYLAMRFRKPRHLATPWLWVGLSGFVPAAAYGLHRMARGEANPLWLFIAAIGVFGPLFLTPKANWRRRVEFRASDPAPDAETAIHAAPDARNRWRGALLDLAAWLVFALLLFPPSVGVLAGQAGRDMHPVCYLIGPATYFQGTDLVPGRDYFTQYGIGPGFVFSHFLGQGARSTLENYIRFLLGLIWVFFGVAYLVLRPWFGSRAWAFGTVLTALILNFCGLTPFNWPSSWVIRYPLLFIFVWLMARAFAGGGSGRWVLAGACAGLAVFWNTETGLYLVATGTAAQVLLWRDRAHRRRAGLSFVTAVVASFFGISGLVYGGAVFSRAFLEGLIEPLILYGAGLGGVKVDGRPGWSYLNAIVAPVLLTATIGWCVAAWSGKSDPARCRSLVLLLLLALVGECLLLKWVNRALTVVWNVNAMPTLAVVAWWLRWWIQGIAARQPATGYRPLMTPARAAAFGIIALAGVFLLTVRDFRWRFPLAARAYARYPGLIQSAFTEERPEGWPTGLGEVAGRDVDLIRRWTRPGDRVAVVARLDWVYLVAAHRAPKLHVVPSAWVFLDWQIDRSLEGANQIFVEIDGAGHPVLPPITFGHRLATLLEREYVVQAVGTNLTLFSREPRASANVTPGATPALDPGVTCGSRRNE